MFIRILITIVVLLISTNSHAVVDSFKFAIGAACSSGSTGGNAISETFNTSPGYDSGSWTDANETDPDPDYTATLIGTSPWCVESVYFTGTDNWNSHPLSTPTHIYISFYINIISEGIGAAQSIDGHYIRLDAAQDVHLKFTDAGDDGDIDLVLYSKLSSRGTIDNMVVGTTYKVRMELLANASSDTLNLFVYSCTGATCTSLFDSVELTGADYLGQANWNTIFIGPITGSGTISYTIENFQVDTSGYIN